MLAVGIVFSLFSTLQVVAASPFESSPANLEALKQKLSDSLVGVTCQTTSIGYSENVVITDDNKNNGNNSYIVTSYRALLPCINNRNLPVTVTYKGKNYKAQVWSWSANADDDFASVMTTVYVPPIPGWSRYRPEKNWWLLYVQWGEGVLLTDPKKPEPVFSNTSVYTVSDKTFTLSASPLPFKVGLMKHGFFFDKDGYFVGSLKWVYDKDPISIAGFPRICTVIGGNSSDRSLLTCGDDTREELWGVAAPTSASPTSTPSSSPKPSPSPTQTNDAYPSADSAYNSGLQAYKSFTSTRQDCLDTFRISQPEQKKLMSFINSKAICGSEDSAVNNLYKELLANRPIRSSNVDFTALANRLNTLSEEIDNSAAVISDGTSMALEVLALTTDFNTLDKYLLNMGSVFSRIERTLAQLPTRISGALRLNSVFDDLEDYKSLYEDGTQEFNTTIDDMKELAYPDISSIQEKGLVIQRILSSLPGQTIFDRSIKRTLDSIPPFYCKKGKESRLPISGKCPSGYTKSSIKKY